MDLSGLVDDSRPPIYLSRLNVHVFWTVGHCGGGQGEIESLHSRTDTQRTGKVHLIPMFPVPKELPEDSLPIYVTATQRLD